MLKFLLLSSRNPRAFSISNAHPSGTVNCAELGLTVNVLRQVPPFRIFNVIPVSVKEISKVSSITMSAANTVGITKEAAMIAVISFAMLDFSLIMLSGVLNSG